ncbi:hypothetical protein L6164_024708 [Bauhinia variegata]|uniref:Uncharacterized protein n=1 Tax=Bauhinia variegata TaxID=167791 RepID=A0ACB9M1C3_BAUVA|nr:hypothetical protein L6164_024708 [Bauhinia variegata]
MGESCQSCNRSWAEEIYWNHFQFVRFAQFLPTGYDQKLALPRRFSDSLKKKLPGKVTIRGPGGAVWSIGLTTRDDTLFFTHGWQQFVKDHKLEENDLLVFKFNGESQFDVLIFDRESFCEKVASYFVRKCEHTERANENLNARKETYLEEVYTPCNAGVECASPQKSMDGDSTRVPAVVPCETTSKMIYNIINECATPQETINEDMDGDVNGDPDFTPSQTDSKRIRKLVSAVKHVQTKRRGRPPKASAARSAGIVNWVAGAEPSSLGKSGTFEAYISKRRPVTEDEKDKVLQLAEVACTHDSFYLVMRPSHVYRKFYLTIPTRMAAELLPPQNQDVILRTGNSEWIARYTFVQNRGTGGLAGGWKHFALDNNLEEFDVCVFKPSGKSEKYNALIMDVSIFRVVHEVTPLEMDPGSKQVRRRMNKAIHI